MDDLDKVLDEAEDTAMAEDMAQIATKSISKLNTVVSKKDSFLKYEFTEEEIRKISQEMARNVKERDSVISEAKSVKGQFDARKKVAEAAILECAEKISSGYEYRSIECEVKKDFTNGRVITIRLDNYSLVEDRKMTVADRQMTIQEG